MELLNSSSKSRVSCTVHKYEVPAVSKSTYSSGGDILLRRRHLGLRLGLGLGLTIHSDQRYGTECSTHFNVNKCDKPLVAA